MLSSPDLAIARRDAALPGLATLLDPDALLALLRRHAPDRGLVTLRVTYVRYKPGENCLAAFAARTADGATMLGYAKTYRDGQSVKLERARTRAEAAGPWGTGRFVVDSPLLTVCTFPNDDKLPTLLRVAETDARHRLLRRLLPNAPALWDAELRVLRYKPERRLVGCVSIPRSPDAPRAAIRCYTPRGFGRAGAAQDTLRSGTTLRVAEVLGKSRSTSAVALAWLPGTPLSEAARPVEPDVMPLVGVALAELHAQRLSEPHDRSAGVEAAEWRAAAESLRAVHPVVGARASALVEDLTASLPNRASSRLVHGDFYAQQVVVDGSRIGIIDLDRAGWGDPAIDLGTFIAHLERDVLAGELQPADLETASAALLAGYRSAGGLVEPRQVGVHTAAALIRLATEPFRTRDPEWPARTEALVDRAAALATSSIATPRPVSPSRPIVNANVSAADSFGASSDPALPSLRRALDPAVAESVLQPVAASMGASSLVLREARVIRYKPGKRCLVQYDAELLSSDESRSTVALLGKLRARGVDRRASPLLAALRAHGFGDDAPDGISVPAPLGVVPDLGLWLQKKVDGVPATDLLADAAGAAIAVRIAKALRKLHDAGVPTTRRHGIADEMLVLRSQLDCFVREHPRFASRIARLVEACTRLAAQVAEPAVARGIHRDFYGDQVVVDGGRLYLVDFDLYCMGDPALDAGNFLGHLIEQSLRTFGNADAMSGVRTAFAEEFLRDADTEQRRAVEMYTALTVARHVYISTRIHERRSITELLLQWCEVRLDLPAPHSE